MQEFQDSLAISDYLGGTCPAQCIWWHWFLIVTTATMVTTAIYVHQQWMLNAAGYYQRTLSGNISIVYKCSSTNVERHNRQAEM